MSFTAKVDVLDFLINCLKDQEREIDNLITRLEKVVEKAEG